MDPALVIVICLFVTSALATMKQARFARFLPLEGKNITTALISTSKRVVAAGCARQCADLDTCESFFYNTVTEECQYHDAVFTTSAGSADQEGMEYYNIIKGPTYQCPVEQGFDLLSEDGPCVKFHTDMKTWDEANETCASYSPYSRLVVLDNQEKNELVKAADMAINNQFNEGVWIGLQEYAQNTYRWLSGQDMDFSDWGIQDYSTNAPDDCGYIHRSDGWRWAMAPRAWNRHFICEIVNY